WSVMRVKDKSSDDKAGSFDNFRKSASVTQLALKLTAVIWPDAFRTNVPPALSIHPVSPSLSIAGAAASTIHKASPSSAQRIFISRESSCSEAPNPGQKRFGTKEGCLSVLRILFP